MTPIDLKTAINQDIAEIDLALSVLNGLRDANQARLTLMETGHYPANLFSQSNLQE